MARIPVGYVLPAVSREELAAPDALVVLEKPSFLGEFNLPGAEEYDLLPLINLPKGTWEAVRYAVDRLSDAGVEILSAL